jgi:GxxExxY protein
MKFKVDAASDFDPLTQRVIGCAMEVHKALGPGLLESAYEECLAHELYSSGLRFARQMPLPILYKGIRLDCGYRLDLVVDEQVVIELKSIESVLPIHEAQILTYLRLSGMRTGLILNFNVSALKDGIHRFKL